MSGIGYKLELKSLYIENITYGQNSITYTQPDANTLEVKLTGINVNAEMDSTAYILYFIPTSTKYFNITNITATLHFKINTQDDIHWQLVGLSSFTLEDLNLVMESSFINFWLNTFHGLAVKAAQKAITIGTDYFNNFV
jgi:hypothetical protein